MSDYIDGCNCYSCTEARARIESGQPPNPVNAQELVEFIPVLRELDAQERFEMRMWANGLVNPNAADYTECGTQFCAAGAKAAVDGWRPQYEPFRRWDAKKQKHVDVAVATGKFVRPEHRDITDFESPLARDAQAIASEAFNLDERQATFLFHGTHISRVVDLVRRIQWLIDGEHVENYPEALIDLEHRHGAEDAVKRRAARDKAFELAAAE